MQSIRQLPFLGLRIGYLRLLAVHQLECHQVSLFSVKPQNWADRCRYSMYIFCNMLVGVVVENFSYVYSLWGSKTLSRDEMRAFKRAWGSCDIGQKGYLQRHHFIKFFSVSAGLSRSSMSLISASF